MMDAAQFAEVRERLARVEEKGNERDRRLVSIEGKLDDVVVAAHAASSNAARIEKVEKNVESLVKSAHMGLGAWWLLVRIGTALIAVAASGAGVVAFLQWLAKK